MSARHPLFDDPLVSTHGSGNYGVRFTRFVLSGAPGGYSAIERVHLFPTRKDRDRHAAELRRKHRGSRRTGPIVETFERAVAPLSWFDPVYLQATLLDVAAEHKYGMVRIYDTKPPVYYVRYANSERELRWMLADQWDGESPEPLPGAPRAPYDVYFFTADEAPQLRIVIETDDLDDDSEGGL